MESNTRHGIKTPQSRKSRDKGVASGSNSKAISGQRSQSKSKDNSIDRGLDRFSDRGEKALPCDDSIDNSLEEKVKQCQKTGRDISEERILSDVLITDTCNADVSRENVKDKRAAISIQPVVRKAMSSLNENVNVVEKAVAFNLDTDEMSIGGTQTKGKLFKDHSTSSNLTPNVQLFASTTVPNRNRKSDNVSTVVSSNLTPVGISILQPLGSSRHNPIRRYTTDFGTPDCYAPVTFETPLTAGGTGGGIGLYPYQGEGGSERRTSKKRVSGGEWGEVDGGADGSGITVGVRVRPFTARELNEADIHCVVSMINNETIVTLGKGEVHRFAYDYSFWSFNKASIENVDETSMDPLNPDSTTSSQPYADQMHVYEALAKPLLAKVFEGYNTCLFAYGQTGSGKSYSVMGHGSDVGIIPRFCEDLFTRISQFPDKSVKLNVELSFFEIYNEKIYDLLASSAASSSSVPASTTTFVAPAGGKDKGMWKKNTLRVREHPILGPYVEGLSSYVVESFDDVSCWLNVGNKRRATAATLMNEVSSRSHSVFTMLLTQTRTAIADRDSHEHSITSKISLVDLAGSERQSLAKTSGDRLREGSIINKSLMTLGKVIVNLAENSATANTKKRKIVIPYRESVLTWLLKESLGGNSKTAMLATISPSNLHAEETLSALRYAKQARSIINMARINEDPKARLIRVLRLEIEKLRSQMGAGGGSLTDGAALASIDEIASLKEQLMKKEVEMENMTRSWQERLAKSEERRREEAKLLEDTGLALKLDTKLPNLVNLSKDPQLTGVLMYILSDGRTDVGRVSDVSNHGIKLDGLLIASHHCVFENVDGLVTVTPIAEAPTYVNGTLISQSVALHHGDRLVLGNDHYFRFSNPLELGNANDGHDRTSQLKDFEFAKEELMKKQNERLEAELESVRQRHEAELRRIAQEKVSEQSSMAKRLALNEALAETKLSEYKGVIADLERSLEQNRQQAKESNQGRLQAEEMAIRLDNEKKTLQQKMLLGHQTEAVEILEPLHHEPLNFDLECTPGGTIMEMVERLKEGVQTPSVMMSTSYKSGVLALTLKLREANKLVQRLNIDAKFTREMVCATGGSVKNEMEGDKQEMVVMVTRTAQDVVCFWTVAKFEQKLKVCKEVLNEGDDEAARAIQELILFDTEDCWENGNRISKITPVLSPHMAKSLRRQSGVCNPSRPNAPIVAGDTLDSSNNQSPNVRECLSVTDIVLGILAQSMGQFARTETTPDRFLRLCQTVKSLVNTVRHSFVTHIAEAAKQPQHSKSNPFSSSDCFNQSSIELTSAFSSLSILASDWIAWCGSDQSELTADRCDKMSSAILSLGSRLQRLIQGCGSTVEAVVHEMSVCIIDIVQELAQLCGQLSLSTNAPVLCLPNTMEEQVGGELKHQFMYGCELVIDCCLQQAIGAMEYNEIRAIDMSEEFRPYANSERDLDEVLRQIQLTVSSTTVLLRKLQDVQVKLDTSILATGRLSYAGGGSAVLNELPTESNRYDISYQRCTSLQVQIERVIQSVDILLKAANGFVVGEDEQANIQSLIASADTVYSVALNLRSENVLPRNDDDDNRSSISSTTSKFNRSSAALLSDSQTDLLDLAAQEVTTATNRLASLANKLQAGLAV